MNNTFKVIVGVIVAVAVLGIGIGIGKSLSQPSTVVGGERAGLQEFKDGVTSGDITYTWVTKKLEAGTNAVLLYNNTSGKDVLVDYGEANVLSGQTASSTSNISIFSTTTTSSSGITLNDFTALTGNSGKQSLINQVTLATSTTATTTSSVYAASAQKGNGAILVPSGSAVWGYLQQNLTLANSACSAAGLCETATSSNRGFNPVFNIRIHFAK